MRRRSLSLGLALGLTVFSALGAAAWRFEAYRVATNRRVSDEIALALVEHDRGRPDLSARRLSALDAEAPGRPEVALELGLSELARGRVNAASAAFDRVPPGSPLAGRAAAPRANFETLRGRFSAAEDLLKTALDRPTTIPASPARREARDALVRLLRSEGRFAEARRVFLDGFTEWPDPVQALRALYRLDADAFPAEGVRVYLASAVGRAPDDDRVWLGLANLDLRLGRLDDAARRLDDCLRRRPDDPAVWRARLDWARQADRPAEAAAALDHLPPDPLEAAGLRAWFAARQGDPAAEHAALERWSALEPGRTAPLDRLAALDLAAGKPTEAEARRARQAEVNRDRAAYEARLSVKDPRPNAAELAGLATRLGWAFEARAWSAVAGKASASESRSGDTPDGPVRLRGLVPEAAGSFRASARPGVTEAPTPTFADDATAAGLTFAHESGSSGDRRKMTPPVTASGGVGLLDVDGDGRMDVYCVQGGVFPPESGAAFGDRLYRNTGRGTFEDITARSGLAARPGGYGHGVAVGDVNGDGRPDLFVTRWHSYALYLNTGGGAFEDATDRYGLGGDRDWPTSAAFADFDGDGDLDLYVCHYLRWDDASAKACVDPRDPSQYHCAPRDFEALPDHLFRNDGGRFVDVSAGSGVKAGDTDGRGLGVVAADLDGDGRVDLFVANDTTANFFWRNLGGWKFEERALISGVGGNAAGGYQAGMGVACGDLDGDGLPDLLVTNFYGESTTFFRNLGGGQFADQTAAVGLTSLSRDLLGFGVALLDADDDGRLDLLTANGHVHDGRPQFPWAMPAQLLRGLPAKGGRLVDVSARAGPPFQVPHIARGLAAGDLDNDGKVDALLVAQDEPLVYLHNTTAPGVAGRSLTLTLEGKPPASNRDAVGAAVTVEVAGRRQTAWRVGGGSFQSAPDPRLHFGLGHAESADRVGVRWPSGRVETFDKLRSGAYRVLEGEGIKSFNRR